MARSNRKRASKPSNRGPMGGKKHLSIGEFSISDLRALSQLQDFPGIVLMTGALFVIIVLLVQIRSLRSSEPPAFVDRSPSYKFYKARFLRSDDADCVAICLGICQILAFIDCDPAVLQASIYEYLSNGAGANSRFIERPNRDNFYSYFHGVVARISGLLNSCPATNASVFNLPRDVNTLSVSQVIDLLPFENRPSVEEVSERIRQYGLDGNDQISFAEAPLPMEGGLTVLEKELFGDKISRTGSPVSASLARPSSIPGNAVTRQDLESVLSPSELLAYDRSAQFNPSRMKELSDIAVERINSSRSARDTVATASPSSGDSTALAPVVDATVATPSVPSVVPPPGRKGRRPKKAAAASSSAEGSPQDEKKNTEGSGGEVSV